MLVLSVVSSRFPYMSILISGGYSDGAPPLPIPNREVKPVRADGTASSGRVGSRRFFPEESGIPHNVECRISDLYNIPQFGITECLIQYKCSVHTPPSHAIRSG